MSKFTPKRALAMDSEPPILTGALPIAYPLDDFYAQAGLPLPRITAIPGEAMPEPYRTLLVHQNDMTSTLEKFHKSTVHYGCCAASTGTIFISARYCWCSMAGRSRWNLGPLKLV